jgi:hypothetical protein
MPSAALRFRSHLISASFLLLAVVVLFRRPLFTGHRFIGNSDRWNHYLSLAALHADHLAAGRVAAWSDLVFGGFDTLALPFSFPTPLFALPALLGTSDVVRVFGYVAPTLLFLTLLVTYGVLYRISGDALAALAGAIVYGYSTFSLFKLSQNDDTFISLLLAPLMFSLVDTASARNAGTRTAALAGLVAFGVYVTSLQKLSYLVLFLLAYAGYRAWQGRRAPGVALAAALVLGTAAALPRVLGLAATVLGSTRADERGGLVEYVGPALLLRFFNVDIFGRSGREATDAHAINLSEGNLLFASAFASLLLLLIVARRPYAAVTVRAGERRVVGYGFFVAFIVAVFVVVHLPVAYRLFALLYGGISFLHTRLVFAALLPIALVSTLYLTRDRGWRLTRSRAAGVAALALGALALDRIDFDRVTAALSPALAAHPRVFVDVPRLRDAAVVLPEVVRWLVLAAAFGALVLARRWAAIDGNVFRTSMAVIVIGQALVAADHFVNGPHTRTYAMPFERHDLVMAAPDEFVPPTAEQLRRVAAVLDNDHYRSVIACPHGLIVVECSTAVALTWRIRLADGYLSGLPHRYASLPWPPDVRGIRSLRIPEVPADPGAPLWKLLALLNVRQIVEMTPALSTNRDGAIPDGLRLVRNPSPYVYPRAYFAEATHAVDRQGAARAIRERVGPCPPHATDCERLLTRRHAVDYVEGAVRGPFDGSGRLTWVFDGDRASFRFPASAHRRFLVVNERYHPGWRAAAAGRELDVYPTNVVMRGVVVPEGATELTLTYTSRLQQPWLYVAGLLPLVTLGLPPVRRRLASALT